MFKNFCFFSCLFFSFWAAAQSHTIEVEIKSISNLDGNLRIGLYNSSVEFPEEHATFMNKVIAVSSSSITFSFTEVPEGTYCVSLYQDLNYNNKLDYNFVGLPLEAYGFSNNIIPMFRAPTFEECSIFINQNTKIDIKLKE